MTTEDPWKEAADGWDDDPVVRQYAEAAYHSLTAACPLSRDLRVLDFGCGTGLLTAHIAPHVRSVLAVDRSAAMVDQLAAKGLDGVEARVADWTSAGPGDAGPFDLIVCSSVLAFVDDPPAAVRMLASLLAPGGMFVQWDWELDPSAEEPYGLTREGMRLALEAAGLLGITVEVGFDIPVGEHRMRPLMGVGRASAPAD